MFEPFYTTKPLGKGTGLGLAISKTTMNRHNGALEYDKKCKNTCFIMKLPSSMTTI
jgi:signal transduction histidine kinase